ALFFLLIAGLTWQLAQALATRRYLLKQEEFLSNVTHELKSPLAAIKLHAQTLSAGELPPEQRRRSLELVLQQADRMAKLGGEVRCRVRDDGARVHIAVEDDGVGIPRKELTRIFDRFYQAGNERDGRRSGTGLGLSIVAGLVHEMRGRVEAFSPEGRPGATFV